MIVLRVVEKLLILYYGASLLLDAIFFLYAFFVFKRRHKSPLLDDAYRGHFVSILVPGYNEEVTIVPCIQQLLKMDYPEYDIIFINDGSSDKTLDKILHAFPLKKIKLPRRSGGTLIDTCLVRGMYQTPDGRLQVIDKENGGKADSVNAGINASKGGYVCTVDADSVLDSNALKAVILPMLHDKRTFVSGGQLAAANGVSLKDNRISCVRMPRNIWVLWQIVEYIKSFMISKIGLSKINALLVMSGAFSVFRRVDLQTVGGFLTQHNQSPYIRNTIGVGRHTVCEDMEIVVRLWRYYHDTGRSGKAVFMPAPVCWTEVPDNARNLFQQRVRWHVGLMETLKIHAKIVFEPSYKTTGMVAMPYYGLFEMLNPLVKIGAFLYLIAAFFTGIVDIKFLLLLIIGIMLLTALFTSIITVVIEGWSIHQVGSNRDALRYHGFGDWLRLLGAGLISDFTYGFFKTAAQLKGTVDFIRSKSEWNKFGRKGFSNS